MTDGKNFTVLIYPPKIFHQKIIVKKIPSKIRP